MAYRWGTQFKGAVRFAQILVATWREVKWTKGDFSQTCDWKVMHMGIWEDHRVIGITWGPGFLVSHLAELRSLSSAHPLAFSYPGGAFWKKSREPTVTFWVLASLKRTVHPRKWAFFKREESSSSIFRGELLVAGRIVHLETWMSSGNRMFLTGSPNAPKLVVFCPSGIKGTVGCYT